MVESNAIDPRQRVGNSNPCPICGHKSWCFWLDDGSGVICMRTESGKSWGDGWLHRADGSSIAPASPIRVQPKVYADMESAFKKLHDATPGGFCATYSEKTGINLDALKKLRCAKHGLNVAAFPMSGENGVIRGIRLRSVDGRKWAVKGSNAGLFVPVMETKHRIVICEGPTDTAAMLSLGYYAIGRPSCLGQEDMVAAYCRGKEAVILGDPDGPGRRGALRLAGVVFRKAKMVRLLEPLAGSDCWDWIKKGATMEEVGAAIDCTWLWSPGVIS